MAKARGNTLVEMLVVLATLMLLAAVLLPVFRAARDAAKQATCLSNFRQVSLASQIYLADYEDRYVPVNHRPGFNGPPGEDRTWVQIVLPYVKSFGVFRCPGDYARKRGNDGVFDGDLVVNDTDVRFFSASQRVNLGYNHQYLSPVVRVSNAWTAMPRFGSQVSDPAQTLMFVDSVWRTDRFDRPSGGGRWLVSPPCRYELRNGAAADTFASEGQVWSPDAGWTLARGNLKYGGAWPWHPKGATVVRMDGSAKAMTMTALTSGCRTLPFWGGVITDPEIYLWDLR